MKDDKKHQIEERNRERAKQRIDSLRQAKAEENKENIQAPDLQKSSLLKYQHIEPKLKLESMQESVREIQEKLKMKYTALKEKCLLEREQKELEECTYHPKINK